LYLSITQTISDVSLQKISEKCVDLRQLCVSKCAELTDQTLIALAQHNPYLNTLEVAGCHQFTDLGFQELGRVNIFFFLFFNNVFIVFYYISFLIS